MKILGIIGNPLGHSFSRKYFTQKFAAENITDTVYENFQLDDISVFPGLLQSNPDILGLNVTIPYKEAVIPYLDCLSEEAKEVGAVNCISVKDGILTGHNTDIYGFRLSLNEFIGKDRPRALVLGTGGASKAVRYVLGKMGIGYKVISRQATNGNLSYGQLDGETMQSHLLIINTTPLGTFPDTNNCPDIPYLLLNGRHLLYDLVYNPETTEFMKRGIALGARATNGYKMLVGQAEKAWQIWHAT